MLLRSALLVVLVGSGLGCGADVDDIFGNPGSVGEGGATSTTSGTSTHAAATNSAVGPGTTVASVSVSVGATTSSSAAGGPVVFCMDLECAPGDICCFYKPFAGQDECSATSECPRPQNDYIQLECNGPEDCPGAECCGGFDDQDGWQYTQCKNHCNEGNEIVMCYGDPSVCSGGEMCKPSAVLGVGYDYCG